MDYEKKHQEDLEAAKGWLAIAKENNNKIAIQILEKLFPELRESEDERIRKALLEYFGEQCDMSNWNGVYGYEIYSWLEKQSEQNTANFNEAEREKNNFVCRQFIECRKSFNEFKEFESYWLEYVGDDTYIGRSDNILNQRFHITPQQLFTLFTHQHCPKDNENQCEQKSIQPKFRVGDWAVHDMSDGRKVIRQIINMTNKSYVLDGEGFNTFYFNDLENDYHLWTIQDAKDGDVLAYPDNSITLFKYRVENIYMAHILWVDGHIELNNSCAISNVHPATKEQCDLLFQKMKEVGYEWDAEKKELKMIEQNPAWSEEDEDALDVAIRIIQNGGDDCAGILDSDKALKWLKSIKDIVKPQPKQEWSEEDKSMYIRTLGILGKCYMGELPTKVEEELKWFKSIEPNHWKPSEEQMIALRWVLNNIPYNKHKEVISQMFEELKKL